MNDAFFMKRALELARKGSGRTSPNPLVGAVLVKDGEIIGEGYHQYFGGKHAEVNAIENAGESVEGATLYCNLEPCCHTIPRKKTPPCTLRIIREKIARVVIANRDPNPYVNGNGVQMLQNHGIEVTEGVLVKEAALLNEKYFKFIRTGQPFVHLKIAQSLDGRIATATGDSQWITDRTALTRVHRMRSEYDAVMVGANTVVKDNPSLTVRLVEGRNPRRVILDDQLIIPDGSHLTSDGLEQQTTIFTVQPPDHPRVKELQDRNIQVITVNADSDGKVDIREVLRRMAELNIASVLVEGGGELFTSFTREKLFDKISVFIAPIIIGEGINSIGNLGILSLSEAIRLEEINIETIGEQVLVEGYRDFSSIFQSERQVEQKYEKA